MSHLISDALVADYAARVRAGESTKDMFPTRMSDCAFTPQQREMIRQARVDRRATMKMAIATVTPTSTPQIALDSRPPTPKHTPGLSKLGRLLYLQSGRCFFCDQLLAESDASIEHLYPRSLGGTRTEDNEVVCHKTLNQVFGNMDIKQKFAFVLKSAGDFKCPRM